MFSRRTSWSRTPNPLTEAVARLKAGGTALVDLTTSNPTSCGFAPPPCELPAVSRYEPAPLGLRPSREAVARYYADGGVSVDPEHIILTASTSEAYAFVFKLLCDPGERVMVPRPSYPLFDFLAELDALTPMPFVAGDLDAVARGVERGARAVVLVHPNNPTGAFVSQGEAAALTRICATEGAALIVDEVFADFLQTPSASRAGSFAATEGALTFTLSGLSKICGLPGHKLGWIVVSGPDALRREALERLEVISDTYLSVATPVQHALPALLEGRHAFQYEVQRRMARNRAALEAAVPGVLPAEGGWTAVVQLAGGRDDETTALRLAEDHGVLVHPGYLFDFEASDRLVVSLIVPEAVMDEGAARLSRLLA